MSNIPDLNMTCKISGMIRCGECGCMVTAENKIKKNKNGNVHHYTYYHCTKRKGPCSQKCIEVDELEKQIKKTLAKVQPPEEFHGWAMKWLQNENEREAADRNAILSNQQKNYEVCVKKLDALIDMRAAGEISEEEFTRKKSEVNQEKAKLHELLNDTDSRIDSWLQTADNILTFAGDASEAFTERGQHARKVILSALGSNLLLKDKNIRIDTNSALLPLILVSSGSKQKIGRLEPAQIGSNKEKSGAFGSANPTWLGDRDLSPSSRPVMGETHLSRVGVRYAARHIVRRSPSSSGFRPQSSLASNQFESLASHNAKNNSTPLGAIVFSARG